MEYFYLFVLSLVIVGCSGDNKFDNYEPNVPGRRQSNAKYDDLYGPVGNFGDDIVDDTDDISRTAPGDENPTYGNYKGFDYAPPKFPPYYKGEPPVPYWKGSPKSKGDAGDSNLPSVDAYKMMEMIMMANAMNKLQGLEKGKDKGFLSKLFSDPKSLILPALVPLSIVLAAVIPVLVNYKMTGTNLTMVSTTASNKKARHMEGAPVLDSILEKFEEIARHIETDDCIQKTLCHVASQNSTIFGNHFTKAASTVAGLLKDDWIHDVRVKSLVKGLKQGNCENVCKSLAIRPRTEKKI